MEKFYFVADTVDGKIKEFPLELWLNCDKIKLIGLSEVRNYNGNECIQVLKILLVYYEGQLLGTRAYKTLDSFIQARKNICYKVFCNFLVNGCYMMINNCQTEYQ